jgi:hypothetical protein
MLLRDACQLRATMIFNSISDQCNVQNRAKYAVDQKNLRILVLPEDNSHKRQNTG